MLWTHGRAADCTTKLRDDVAVSEQALIANQSHPCAAVTIIDFGLGLGGHSFRRSVALWMSREPVRPVFGRGVQ